MKTVTWQQVLGLLPQTQCTRCGYPDCAGYAKAISQDHCAINRCPPGGQEGVRRLAALTGQEATALDPLYGAEAPLRRAFIDETWCIGCTLCIKACPVDCIVGASKQMHTVIESLCTGCDLCVPACPVDCIEMHAVGPATGWEAWSAEQAQEARERYEFHQFRVEREAREHDERLAGKAQAKLANLAAASAHTDPDVLAQKRAVIQAALDRARAKKNTPASREPSHED